MFTKDIVGGYAKFNLIQPESNGRYFKGDGVRFSSKELMYEWKSMITNGKVSNLVMLDLII